MKLRRRHNEASHLKFLYLIVRYTKLSIRIEQKNNPSNGYFVTNKCISKYTSTYLYLYII